MSVWVRWLVVGIVLVAAGCSEGEGSVERADPFTREGPVIDSVGDSESVLVGRSQRVVDGSVVVDRVELEAPGYAVLYADGGGAPGVQVGVSGLLDAGVHEDVEVPLAGDFDAGSVFVVVHLEDSGNESMDFPSGDAPAQGDAGVVTVELPVST